MVNLNSSNWFGPLFFSQNWTNSENILKNSNFSQDFDNFCRFFECHSILAEKQQTKQTNYSSLRLSASLDIQDILQGGMIVEWKKFWQEIPVCILIGGFQKYNHLKYSPSSFWNFVLQRMRSYIIFRSFSKQISFSPGSYNITWIFEKENKSTKIILVISVNIFRLAIIF